MSDQGITSLPREPVDGVKNPTPKRKPNKAVAVNATKSGRLGAEIGSCEDLSNDTNSTTEEGKDKSEPVPSDPSTDTQHGVPQPSLDKTSPSPTPTAENPTEVPDYQSRIFLCHAKEDKPRVKELYHHLKAASYHPWLDEEDILPGANWELEIRRAIRGSVLFLACLSQRSLNRKGCFHKEIKMALDGLDQMPEGEIYLIPVRLEECQVPDRLQSRQWVDLFKPDGFEKIKRALDFEIAKREPPRQTFEPELILIPAGEFLMGSDPQKHERAYEWEQPQHTLYLPDYFLAKTPVTNAQYAAFLKATDHKQPEHWEGGQPPKGKEDHPVIYVAWHDAVAYCDWLAKVTGKPYRLPSEAEWEKGARGTDGRIYPWGNEWDAKRCNSWEARQEETTPVGAYPQGASPYGLLDMAGNVWEWTRSLFREYPYNPKDGREDPAAGGYRVLVLRGGSWSYNRSLARCAFRFRANPSYQWYDRGFRIVVSPISP